MQLSCLESKPNMRAVAKGDTPEFVFFFGCYAATQVALQLNQERTQLVCSNREARKCPARGHSRNGALVGTSGRLRVEFLLNTLFFPFFFLFVASSWVFFFVLRVEFVLKTESGYLRDAEVTLFTLANP